MSSQLLNTELEKQIGCMNGMFQMFDRHCLGRGLSRKSNQREEEYSPSSPQMILERSSSSSSSSRKSSSENRRVSTESSRSSIPSSSSSLDYIKTTSTNTRNEASIKGELRGLSVKKGKVVKFRDSPRPTLPADFSPSSSNFLARLKEAPRNLPEAPRLSCDGREISRTKSAAGGIRELPRLSLDSSLHRRSPSVIAKLMGLEAMPPSSESQETTAVLPRKKDRTRHSSTPAVSKKQQQHNETVYSQIERRVKELDFHESNKDLRALKHILGTLQVKGLLSETNDQLDKLQINTTTTTAPPRAFESPIVIVKPAKTINRLEGELEGLSGLRKLRTSSRGTASRKQAKVEANDLRGTSGEKKQRSPVMQQRSPRPQLSPAGDTSASPVKTPSTRVHQRKMEPEKKPRTPPPTQRQSANRQQQQQQQEPMSPRVKTRLKPNRAEKYNQQVDKQVSSRDDGGNVSLPASGYADDCLMKLNSQKKFLLIAEDVSTVLPSEQPSPVSVLDASFYDDELSPSPVKTISTALKGDEMQISTEDYKIPKSPSEASTTKPSPEIDSWKLGNIKSLVQKLKQLSSTNDERQEPVLDYVLEILLASGVQGETTLAKAKPEKLRHKLMLDVVQEVLIHKLESISPSPQWDLFVRARKLGGQLLLRELCSEMKWLQAERPRGTSLEKEEAMSAEDSLTRSQGWEDFGLEVPGLVLEIERSIFKDLIDEVVTGEANSTLLTRRRRQLFT